MNKLKHLWSDLRASLWFVPGVMIAFSIALALVLIEVDSRVEDKWLADYPRLFGLGADGSRGMLTAIASSMLTVAALAFSLTLNAFTQASGQFTPRIFRNFMSDRANQFVLGYFVSVFAFCLLVLRTIRGGDEIKFVPSLAVMTGLLLALGGIAVLIFFIHHIADSLQITTILENVADETRAAIEKLFPAKLGAAATDEEASEADAIGAIKNWRKIPALDAGYVQNANADEMLEYAVENRIIIRMRRGIGQFAATGATLAEIVPDRESGKFQFQINDETIREINDLFGIDRHRTVEQDANFGVRQIVDIALKALSPGINDTTTAVNCIDQLGEIVGDLAERRMPSRVRAANDAPRVVVVAPDFQEFVETAFDQIRASGKANLAIFLRLLETLTVIAERTTHARRRRVLEKQIDLTGEFAAQTLATEYEKEQARVKYAEAKKIFAR